MTRLRHCVHALAIADLRFAAFALAILLASAAGAQTKTGTTTMGFLHIEPSPRMAAQGNAGATAREGVMSAYYNPGALGFLRGSSAEFAHSEWLADIDFNYAGVAINNGSQTLALTVTQLSSGEMDVRTADQPEGTGERFSVNDLAIGVGYGRQFTDRFAGGVQVKYIREQIWHTAASTVALDMGVIYELPFKAVLGASLTNFGTRSRFSGRDLRVRFDQDPDTFGDNDNLPAALETEDFALPIFFRVGMSMPVEVGANSRVTLSADAYQPSDNSNSISLGGEWTYANLISARAGYQNLFLEDGEEGLTVGGGLKAKISGFGVRADYSWGEHATIGDMQRFSIGLDF
ncbi:MAG: hypothetical protein Rubg2KO_28700 [Rubricoccaceae bacterium]